MSRRVRKGWVPDLPDHRDHRYGVQAPVALPPMVDLRKWCPPVYDQGQTNSCTGHAIAGALHLDEIKQGKPSPVKPSPLFIYWNERAEEDTTGQDCGAMIRDGIKSLSDQGFCTEDLWPFKLEHVLVQPIAAAFAAAKAERVSQYLRLARSLYDLKHCLADGFPVVFGMTVYPSFESADVARSGVVPMPGHDEEVAGGHAVLMVGYDDAKKVFIVRNSWGEGWGIQGYFELPYDFVTHPDLSDDFWTIRFVP